MSSTQAMTFLNHELLTAISQKVLVLAFPNFNRLRDPHCGGLNSFEWISHESITEMSQIFATLHSTPASHCTCSIWRLGRTSLAYKPPCLATVYARRNMATVKDSIPHTVRTAADQRQRTLYTATIGRIEQTNSTIRLLRLYLDDEQVSDI